MAHWSEKYVGLEYIPDEFDCAELARVVNLEVFGREIHIPTGRACGLRGLHNQIECMKNDLAERTEQPAEGDGVLMRARGRLDHIGIYAEINGVPHVLHAMRNAGQVTLHRVRDLGRFQLQIEGFYKWK